MFGLPCVLEQPGAADQHPRRVALHDHVGDHLLDELEAGDRDAELLALLRVGDRRVDAALADPDAAGGDAVAAASRARVIATLKPSPTSPSIASSPTSTSSSAISAVSEARRPELAVDLLRARSPRWSVGTRKQARPVVLLLGVGLGEDQRDLGEVAERDPHLLAADRPAAVGLRRAGCAGWRRRSRCRARSARSSRATRPSRAAAASAASAPRCPSARSSRRRARSGRRRRCASEESPRPISSTISP